MRTVVTRKNVCRAAAVLLCLCVLAFCSPKHAHAQTVTRDPAGNYMVRVCAAAGVQGVGGSCDPFGWSVVDSSFLSTGAWVMDFPGDPTCMAVSEVFEPFSLVSGGDGVQVVDYASQNAGCVIASSVVVGTGPGWSPAFDISQLDGAQAGEAFAAGFVIVGMCWALGRAVGMIVSVVKR